MTTVTIREWVGKNILQLLIIAGFIIFGIRSCGSNGSTTNRPKSDTTFTSHTEYVVQPPQVIPQYIPIQSSSQTPIVIPSQYQPSQDLATLIKQYNELASKFLAQNTYKDSISLKDSSGKTVGVVKLEDMISENQIKSRKPNYQLWFPVTTNTVTINNYPKSKAQFYFGGSIAGSQEKILESIGAGIIYKSKKEAMWGAKVNYNLAGKVNYELSRYFKLSLRK